MTFTQITIELFNDPKLYADRDAFKLNKLLLSSVPRLKYIRAYYSRWLYNDEELGQSVQQKQLNEYVYRIFEFDAVEVSQIVKALEEAGYEADKLIEGSTKSKGRTRASVAKHDAVAKGTMGAAKQRAAFKH